jgi:hypothetical protein
MEERRQTEIRARAIKSLGLDLKSIWTCQIERMLQNDPQMEEFFENCHDQGPIALRDSYFGGYFF